MENDLTTDIGQEKDELASVNIEDGVELSPEDGKTAEGESPDDEDRKTEEDDGKKSEINQQAVNKRINKLTRQRYEEERKRKEAEARLKEYEDQKKAVDDNVVIPPVPDIYDPNYDQLMKERDAAIQRKSQADAAKAAENQRYQDELVKRQQAHQKEMMDLHGEMFVKSKDLGIKEEDLKAADEHLAATIPSPDIAKFILELDDSPLVALYLYQNSEALDKVLSMDLMKAAAYLSTTISAEAAKLKPGTSKAPEPIDIPGKKGAPEKSSEYLEGVVFE